MTPIPPTDIQLTLREEGWILSNELCCTSTPEPAIITAFKLLDEPRWDQFQRDINDNPALKFFNGELHEFSGASTWEELAGEYAVLPYGEAWRIDPDMHESARLFCRNLRSLVTDCGCRSKQLHETSKLEGNRHRRLFSKACEATDKVLVVNHYGGCLKPYFDDKPPESTEYRVMSNMLTTHNLLCRHRPAGCTFIYLDR